MIKDNDNGNDAVFINDIVRSYYIDRWQGCCVLYTATAQQGWGPRQNNSGDKNISYPS